MGIVVFSLFAAFVLLFFIYFSKAKEASAREKGLDTLNFPQNMSAEEKTHFKEIADFCGKRYITFDDAKKYTIHRVWKELSAMPGWSHWDISDHSVVGQYERMERGVSSTGDLEILCYDPKYQMAKVKGRSGIYLTSCTHCSCPDFRKRHLPCKHMYAVGIWLEGDIKKQLLDSEHKPLYGLNFALVGRLPKKSKNISGIRSDIESLGGSCVETIEMDTSAVILGTSPSENRLIQAKNLGIECYPSEWVTEIFTPHS